ncbi:MAG TPA: FadR/GntR family transcriptional regulator [Chloroflexota bacterium]
MAEYRRLGSSQLLYESLVDEIEQKIVKGDLKPGDSLPPQEELASRFGVSRTVVREAVQILVARRLVDVQRGKGMVVSHPSSDSVTESLSLLLRLGKTTIPQLTELRMFLEPEMAALAAVRATAAQIAAIREIEAAYRALALDDQGVGSAGSYEKYASLDLAFHQAVWDAAHNAVAKTVLESILGLFRESMIATYSLPGALQKVLEGHRSVMLAIASHDPEGARRRSRAHVNHVVEDQKILDEQEAEMGR